MVTTVGDDRVGGAAEGPTPRRRWQASGILSCFILIHHAHLTLRLTDNYQVLTLVPVTGGHYQFVVVQIHPDGNVKQVAVFQYSLWQPIYIYASLSADIGLFD